MEPEPPIDPQIHGAESEPLREAAVGNGRLRSLKEEEWKSVEARERTHYILPIFLFFLTLFTTMLAGTYWEGGDPFRRPLDLTQGIPFSFTLMSILFIHEMGHYLTSKYYGVKTTLPYFIPGPWPPYGIIGTFGAFIRMRSPILKKAALLDIGAAGPIAGFIVSVIAVAFGLYSSKIIEEGNAVFVLGSPLMFSWIASLLGKAPPPGYDVALNSVAFAGWIGFFVTSLNLLPIGQLDGGHIAYALLGRKQRFFSIGMVGILLFLGTTGWNGWFVWAVLTSVLGVRHPPILDEETPLDWRHRLIGWGSVALFVVTFMPVPFKVG